MRLLNVVGLVVAASTIAGAATAKTSSVSLRDREQAACYNDAQKLCGEFIPDEQKVTACMLSKKSQVSAACAKFYKK